RGSLVAFVYDRAEEVNEQLAQPGLQAMAEVISALYTQGGAPLQVLTCRPATWTLLLDKPTRPGPGQLKQIDQTLKLERLTQEQARELATARLFAQPGNVRSLQPLRDSDVEASALAAVLDSPRQLFVHLATRYTERRQEPQAKPE